MPRTITITITDFEDWSLGDSLPARDREVPIFEDSIARNYSPDWNGVDLGLDAHEVITKMDVVAEIDETGTGDGSVPEYVEGRFFRASDDYEYAAAIGEGPDVPDGGTYHWYYGWRWFPPEIIADTTIAADDATKFKISLGNAADSEGTYDPPPGAFTLLSVTITFTVATLSVTPGGANLIEDDEVTVTANTAVTWTAPDGGTLSDVTDTTVVFSSDTAGEYRVVGTAPADGGDVTATCYITVCCVEDFTGEITTDSPRSFEWAGAGDVKFHCIRYCINIREGETFAVRSSGAHNTWVSAYQYPYADPPAAGYVDFSDNVDHGDHHSWFWSAPYTGVLVIELGLWYDSTSEDDPETSWLGAYTLGLPCSDHVDDCPEEDLPGGAPQTIDPSTTTSQPGDVKVFTTNQSAHWTVVEKGVTAAPGETKVLDPVYGGSLGVSEDGKTGTFVAPNEADHAPHDYTVRAESDGTFGNPEEGDHNYADGNDTNTEPPGGGDVIIDPLVMPDITHGFLPVVYGPDGLRKRLPLEMIRTCKWKDTRYGGWTDFEAELNATFAQFAATGIAPADTFEFWWNGERRYRGEIMKIVWSEEDPENITISGVAKSFRVGKHTCTHALVYSNDTDISTFFEDMVEEFVLPFHSGLTIETEPVGATAQQYESTYKGVSESLNDLCSTQGLNRALWGFDVEPELGDERLYMKAFSTTVTWSIAVPGVNVNVTRAHLGIEDVVNRLCILGGTPRYPNLIYNSSFERPRFAGSGEGELLTDGGFEQGLVDIGTGDFRQSIDVGFDPYAGGLMYETDSTGEYWEKYENFSAPPIIPGDTYVFSIWARTGTSSSTATGSVTIEWLNDTDDTLQTDTLSLNAYGGAAPALADQWDQYTLRMVAPATATGFRVRGECVSGGALHDGVFWDSASFFPEIVYQDKWELVLQATSRVTALDWAYKEAYDGGFSLYLDVTDVGDNDSEDVLIQPVGLGTFDVQGRQVYTMGVWTKSPTGITANPKMYLEMYGYNESDAVSQIARVLIPAGSGWEEWTQHSNQVTLYPTTVKVAVRLRIRGDGALLVDAFSFRSANAGYDYIRDGQFVAFLDTNDATLTDLTSDAAASIDAYNVREDRLSEEGITTLEGAKALATAVFNVRAVGYPSVTLEIVNDPRWFRPGDLVQVIGEVAPYLVPDPFWGDPIPLPLVEVNWAYSEEGLRGVLDMHVEPPDLAGEVVNYLKRSLGGAFLGGSKATTIKDATR